MWMLIGKALLPFVKRFGREVLIGVLALSLLAAAVLWWRSHNAAQQLIGQQRAEIAAWVRQDSIWSEQVDGLAAGLVAMGQRHALLQMDLTSVLQQYRRLQADGTPDTVEVQVIVERLVQKCEECAAALGEAQDSIAVLVKALDARPPIPPWVPSTPTPSAPVFRSCAKPTMVGSLVGFGIGSLLGGYAGYQLGQ